MSNDKHYPTHPGAEHPPIMTCEIPLEEYESLMLEVRQLKERLSTPASPPGEDASTTL